MPSDITLEATYRHPPEFVWKLLSSSQALDRLAAGQPLPTRDEVKRVQRAAS